MPRRAAWSAARSASLLPGSLLWPATHLYSVAMPCSANMLSYLCILLASACPGPGSSFWILVRAACASVTITTLAGAGVLAGAAAGAQAGSGELSGAGVVVGEERERERGLIGRRRSACRPRGAG